VGRRKLDCWQHCYHYHRPPEHDRGTRVKVTAGDAWRGRCGLGTELNRRGAGGATLITLLPRTDDGWSGRVPRMVQDPRRVG